VLEAEGLLSRKTVGRYGGSVVQKTPDHTIRRQLDLFIRGRSISFEDLLRTRQAIEPMLAQLAAVHRTDADLAEIRRRTIALEMAFPDNRHLITLLNVDWHIAVAAASHNELLNALMTGISGALKHAAPSEDYDGVDEACLGVIGAHRKILEAIEKKDPQAARRRMERHLSAYEKELAQFTPSQLDLS
jgi:GntR family transcriptional repressor for pyruvate dehydrogenase complex